MISIVVPVWRENVYRTVSFPWICEQVDLYNAELIEVSGESIFEAHECGRRRALHDIIVYVHDDVRLIEPHDFAVQVVKAFQENPKLGLIGPVGRGDKPKWVPWWINPGHFAGHYMNRKNGSPVYRYARSGKMELKPSEFRGWNRWRNVALVDGFFLIEHRQRMNVPWDTQTFKGHWHGYDADRCLQARKLGFDVAVPPWLFMHDNAGHAGYKGTGTKRKPGLDGKRRKVNSEGDVLWLAHFAECNRLLAKKWGLRAHPNFS